VARLYPGVKVEVRIGGAWRPGVANWRSYLLGAWHYRVVVPGVAGVHGTFYARHSDQVRRLDDEPTPA
jgi:hypothetical protein